MKWGTKGETLERLRAKVRSATVLPQIRFSADEWRRDPQGCLQRFKKNGWRKGPWIVRSSAAREDAPSASWAGHYPTKPDVQGWNALSEAITEVFRSFDGGGDRHQVFVQPFLCDVAMSGVVFSRDPNTGGPYRIVNYDDVSGTTDTVTSGRASGLKMYYWHRRSKTPPDPLHARIIGLVEKLEKLLGQDALDVEFAVTRKGQIHLFQVRPLSIPSGMVDETAHFRALETIENKVRESFRPHPYLCGARTVYGVMPDWNPAEMIGLRPRPLALSLYKKLITDHIWAYQRDNYGYRNLRSFPLLLSFHGLPYIDVRVSFNSFIPAAIERDLAERLVNYYIDRLVESPSHHDKVEFEIIFSCTTLDLPEKLSRLRQYGFSSKDNRIFSASLCRLTNRILHPESGLWKRDLEKIAELEKRRVSILESSLGPVAKIYWLLEDCKRYGTLPFAGLARAGFIAVQLLKSLVKTGLLTEREYEDFMGSLDTVGSRLSRDFERLSRDEFLKRYGHLRPGTYDVVSPRYDESPEDYFDWSKRPASSPNRSNGASGRFRLSGRREEAINARLRRHGLCCGTKDLFAFIRQAIEGREHAKFVFTHSLSDALRLFAGFASENGFSKEDASHADISVIGALNGSSRSSREALVRSIESGKKAYGLTRQITLPPLIFRPSDIWHFEWPPCEPNYVTLGSVSGKVAFVHEDKERFSNSILFLPSADPGYDWIFSYGIAGFITMYGGANSHMAIRAGELGLPAVIGAGEALYQRWSVGKSLRLDCANRQVTILR